MVLHDSFMLWAPVFNGQNFIQLLLVLCNSNVGMTAYSTVMACIWRVCCINLCCKASETDLQVPKLKLNSSNMQALKRTGNFLPFLSPHFYTLEYVGHVMVKCVVLEF
jgi:hypothetical protein